MSVSENRLPTATEEHKCDECGRPIKLFADDMYKGEHSYKQVVGGVCLDFSGGYEEFNDLCSQFASGENFIDGYVALCHDCTVLLYSAIPNAVKKFGFGLHAPDNENSDKPCCRWSWTLKKIDGELRLFVPDDTAEHWIPAPDEKPEN